MVQDGLGSASQADKSFPLLIDAAPQLLGESGHALAMVLLERMQWEVESSFGSRESRGRTSKNEAAGIEKSLQLKPSGAMLFWLSPSELQPVLEPEQKQEQVAAGVEFDSYAVPQ